MYWLILNSQSKTICNSTNLNLASPELGTACLFYLPIYYQALNWNWNCACSGTKLQLLLLNAHICKNWNCACWVAISGHKVVNGAGSILKLCLDPIVWYKEGIIVGTNCQQNRKWNYFIQVRSFKVSMPPHEAKLCTEQT